MAEPSIDSVVRRAAEEVAARRDAIGRDRERRDAPWRLAFVLALAALALGTLLIPGTPDAKLIRALSGVCAQQHNIVLGGMQLPLCARDTGIYLSALLTVAVIVARGRSRAAALPSAPLVGTLLALVAALAVDGLNSTVAEIGLAPLYTPRDDLRAATGMGMGLGVGTLLVLLLNRTLRADPDDRQPVLVWTDLAIVAGLNGLALGLVLGGVALAAWPLALLSAAGVLGTIFVSGLTASGVLLGYEGAAERPAQLARPGTVALLITASFVGSLALLRAWLSATVVGG